MTEKDFFFCYSKKLSNFLTYKEIKYITRAINPATKTMFSMYVKNETLQKALDEYKELEG
ncbi:hypothetical protein [Bacillus sp. Hm123]|uniref:hypothetical protein n=1 Tax=Bacillus sp. Hm123 TaxID=3450745 RepID=UPI003F4320BA